MMSTRRILGAVVTVALLGLSIGLLAIGIAAHMGRLDLEPVLSGSMRPTFQPGDLVAAWRVQVSSLHVGEVIAFVPPGKRYREMHRIVKLSRSGDKTAITTKGDANHVTDPWGKVTLQGKYAYKLAAVIPKLGWVATLPKGIIMPVFLIAAGLIFLVSEITKLFKLRREPPDQGLPSQDDDGLTAGQSAVAT
jgi:signal peptidase